MFKKLILFILKPLSFLPAIIMMYVIFSFSAQSGVDSGNLSYIVSHRIVEIGNEVLEKNLEDWEIDEIAGEIEYPVRKAAHMTEYFLLAVAVSFPFYVYGLRGFGLVVVAGLICVGFACGDEYHQSFVEGRGPSVRDVGIDSIGVFLGITTVRIFCWTVLAPVRMMERSRRRREENASVNGREEGTGGHTAGGKNIK
ncbi:MAG: VanZ family protein [Muricomes sp.]